MADVGRKLMLKAMLGLGLDFFVTLHSIENSLARIASVVSIEVPAHIRARVDE